MVVGELVTKVVVTKASARVVVVGTLLLGGCFDLVDEEENAVVGVGCHVEDSALLLVAGGRPRGTDVICGDRVLRVAVTTRVAAACVQGKLGQYI